MAKVIRYRPTGISSMQSHITGNYVMYRDWKAQVNRNNYLEKRIKELELQLKFKNTCNND